MPAAAEVGLHADDKGETIQAKSSQNACPAGLFPAAPPSATTPLTAVGILKGAASIAKAATGIGLASPETIAARRLTCESCPEATSGVRPLSRCRKCHCSIIWKTRLARQKCPLGKWGIEVG